MTYRTRHILKIILITVVCISLFVAFILGVSALSRWSHLRGPSMADTNESYNKLVPSMEQIQVNEKDVYWTYYVDHTTDYVYLVYDNYHQFGVAALLNTDGTPMTLEQFVNSR